jgi:hypothetical protein
MLSRKHDALPQRFQCHSHLPPYDTCATLARLIEVVTAAARGMSLASTTAFMMREPSIGDPAALGVPRDPAALGVPRDPFGLLAASVFLRDYPQLTEYQRMSDETWDSD